MQGFTRPLVVLIAAAAFTSGTTTAMASAATAQPAAAERTNHTADRQSCQKALEEFGDSLREFSADVSQETRAAVRKDIADAIAKLRSGQHLDRKSQEKLVNHLSQARKQLGARQFARLAAASRPVVAECASLLSHDGS
ncbi:hypothetical protein ACQB60_33360 [Actinomycetota bacterium Odt1-20B]